MRDELEIESADVKGSVELDHPQLKLSSQALNVAFEPVTSHPATKETAQTTIKEVTAEGAVRAAITDPQRTQNITCNRLKLTTAQTPGGKTVVRSMNADGNVHTFDDEQEMTAGQLTVMLVPATPHIPSGAPQPATQPQAIGMGPAGTGGEMELESLLAQQDVRVSAKSGMSATGDELRVTGNGDGQKVVLLGQPNASVSDGTNTIKGQNISMFPNRGQMTVAGPGTLHGIGRETDARDAASARAVDVQWSSGLVANAPSNQIEINGDVRAESRDVDGSEQVATASKMLIALVDAVVPGASTQPDPPPSTQPTLATELNPLRGKGLASMTLQGDAELQLCSAADAATARPKRDVHLFAQTATYDVISRQFKVPCPGRMLVRDDARTTMPATAPDMLAGGNDMRGATAFEWHDQFLFDENENCATMVGQVVIVHQDLTPDPKPFRLEASRVKADLTAPQPSPPTTQPARPEFRVRRLSAFGGVHFTSRQIQFESDELEYDPAAATLFASGNERTPAQLFDDQGVSKGTFEELWYNTKTEQIRLKGPQAHIRR